MRKMIDDLLSDQYSVSTAEDGTRALALLAAGEFDVVVSDIRMPGMDGFALLEEVKRLRPDVEVILVTAYASIPRAVEAMKEGAYHYLRKPFEPDELLLLVQRAIERRRLAERARGLEQELASASRLEALVGKSKVMQRLFQLITRAGTSEATVLITGESGTGKELVARAVHRSSPRNSGPFVAVNCGALPEALVESELFGYVKGAFTGATADKRGLFEDAAGGTLFLDEVGDLPLPLQVKLTRVLQESRIRRVGDTPEIPVDVRVMCAFPASCAMICKSCIVFRSPHRWATPYRWRSWQTSRSKRGRRRSRAKRRDARSGSTLTSKPPTSAATWPKRRPRSKRRSRLPPASRCTGRGSGSTWSASTRRSGR
ncbi:MAG: sigma-54-dependent Fis family transcriptional regulator [Deltaproteobacteria bacterium]|nr:sigma-54-dependent Fis family transcriptional regulator [Deltaproteobacteria bacterium]